MQKVFGLILAVFLLTACGTKEKIAQPKLPVGLDKFEFAEQAVFSCGTLETYLYQNQNWFAVFLDKPKFPKPLVVGIAKGDTAEYWLDNNRDGIFDEHYKSKEAIVSAYPTPCDAVKK